MATNKKLGNSFEAQFCEMMFEQGFWVHNMAMNQAGQPADVIAVKNHKAWLIDCKVCSDMTFPLSRIEENQHLSMDLWKDSGNGEGWFALKIGGKVFMIPHFTMKALSNGKSTLNFNDVMEYGVEFGKWVKKCK